MKHIAILFSSLIALSISSCSSIPEGAKTVENFDKEKYLGKWYEIARFDFIFEKNLNDTTAEYSLREDGTINVLNKGFDFKKNKNKQANGIARFRGSDKIGELEVSFFGPFYSGYNVISIDKDYSYALVVGKNTDYLWILSREKTIPDDIKEKYLTLAKSIGCKIENLFWVKHK